MPMWASGFAGGLARTWSVTIISPIEMIRTKMQAKSTTYKGKFFGIEFCLCQIQYCSNIFNWQ